MHPARLTRLTCLTCLTRPTRLTCLTCPTCQAYWPAVELLPAAGFSVSFCTRQLSSSAT